MRIFSNLLVVIGLLFSISSVAKTLPFDVPADDAAYLYAVGVGESTFEAERSALAAVVNKIYVNVQSDSDMVLGKKDGRISNEFKSTTRSRSLPIDLPSYEVVKRKIKNNQEFLLIKVKRALIAQAVKENIERLSKTFLSDLKLFSSKVGASCWFALRATQSRTHQFNDLLKLSIAVNLEAGLVNKAKRTLKRFEDLQGSCLSANHFRVEVDDDMNRILAAAIEKKVISGGARIGSQDTSGLIKVMVTTEEDERGKVILAIAQAKVLVLDELGNAHKTYDFESKGASFDSFKEAKKNAFKNIREEIKTKKLIL